MTKVLVFESEHAFAMELRTRLTELGCTVQVFGDGQRGMLAAAGATTRPDLVLLSVQLRGVNGFSICNKLKKHPQLGRVPLVLMSSNSSPETFAQHQQLPTRAEAYVHKPVTFEALLSYIRPLVRLSGDTGGWSGAPSGSVRPTPSAPPGPRSSRSSMASPTSVASPESVAPTSGNASSSSNQPTLPEAPPLLDAVTVKANPTITEQVRQMDPALMATLPEEDAIATREAPRPRAFSGYSSPAQRAKEREKRTSARPLFELPSFIDDDDEDEDTIVASRKMLEQAAAQVARDSEAPKPRDSRHPAVTIPSLGSVSKSWPAPGGTPASEIAGLRQALARAVQHGQRADLELAQLRPVAAEAEPLRSQLNEQQQQLTSANNALSGYQRQNGELRDTLQQRDTDLLGLRETLASKERELLAARDVALGADKKIAAVKEKLSAAEKSCKELQATSQTMTAEKALADQRASDFKQGAKKIAEQLNMRSRELRDLRKAHEQALTQNQTKYEQQFREQEVALRQQISSLETSHQQALSELRGQHNSSLDEHNTRHDAELAAQQTSADDDHNNRLNAKQEAWESERSGLATQLSELTAELNERDKRLAEQQKIHSQQLATQKAEGDKALEAMLRENEASQQRQKSLQRDELQQLADQHAATLKTAREQAQARADENADATAKLKEALEESQLTAHKQRDEMKVQLMLGQQQRQQSQNSVRLAEARIAELKQFADEMTEKLATAQQRLKLTEERLEEERSSTANTSNALAALVAKLGAGGIDEATVAALPTMLAASNSAADAGKTSADSDETTGDSANESADDDESTDNAAGKPADDNVGEAD